MANAAAIVTRSVMAGLRCPLERAFLWGRFGDMLVQGLWVLQGAIEEVQ